jgi:hypothetical protein
VRKKQTNLHFVCFHRAPWCAAMFSRQLTRSALSSLPMTWITLQIAAAAAGQHKNLHCCSESVTVSFWFPFQKKPAFCCSFCREKQSSCLDSNCSGLAVRFTATAAQEHGQRYWWQPGSSVGIVTLLYLTDQKHVSASQQA